VIKKKVLLEGLQIDTTDRTEFTLFEAAVLASKGLWLENYNINDPHFDKVAGDIVGSETEFRFDYDNPKNFFEAMGLEWDYNTKAVVDEISRANSSYYGDYFHFSNEEAGDDWDAGYVIKSFGENAYALLLEYFKKRNFFEYKKIQNQDIEVQVEAMVNFFDRSKNVYDKDWIQDIIWEYQSAKDSAYLEGYKTWLNDTYKSFDAFGITTEEDFERFTMMARNVIHQILVLKLPRDCTFAQIVAKIYEQRNVSWDAEIIQWIYDCYDAEIFDNSGFKSKAANTIDNKLTEFETSDDEEHEKISTMEGAMVELEHMGIEIGEWAENNVTPDKKFKFCLTDYDIEEQKFHVRLWDMKKHRSVAGYMTLDGVKALATVPTLFDAEEMLNEKVRDEDLTLPDRMRRTLIESVADRTGTSVTLREVYEKPIAKKVGGYVEYNEIWTPADIATLRSQTGYEAIPLKSAFDKFIQERFTKTVGTLGYIVEDYEFTPHDNADLEYDWWMKVYVKSRL
jgi:hypothetical protein